MKTKKTNTAKTVNVTAKKPVASVYDMKVVATKKAAESRENSFWGQLQLLARKPVVLGKLIEMVAAKPVGVRVKRTPAQRMEVAKLRVRQALTRKSLGYLKRA